MASKHPRGSTIPYQAMASERVVVCRRPYDFPESAYATHDDQFRNALCLPRAVLADLGLADHDYAAIGPADGDPGEDGLLVPVVGFVADYTTEAAEPEAALRSNLVQQLPGVSAGNRLAVRAVDVPTVDGLTVHRTYDDEVDHRACHLSEAVRETVGVVVGEQVELVNADTGGRALVRALPLETGDADLARIDVRTREALDVGVGDTVRVRAPIAVERTAPGATERALDELVGSREAAFRVELGLDRDEYRNVARLNPDMLRFLGIEPGDLAVLDWKGQRSVTQCLLPPDDEDVPPVAIWLPSTERDRIDASVHDVVTVRRETGHVFRKQVALSILGILGVVFGVFQIANVIGLVAPLRAALGTAGTLVALLSVSALASVLVVWLLLFPERQKVLRVTED